MKRDNEISMNEDTHLLRKINFGIDLIIMGIFFFGTLISGLLYQILFGKF